MIAGGNVDGKWSGKNVEGDDGLRTMECLRGRLLAERVASRVAKEDAEHVGNKLIELENHLKVEIKSRNRAEKRLKFLLKKLDSLNISYVSEDSEHSSLLEKSDMSSVSSTASSGTKEPKNKEPKSQFTTAEKYDIEESVQKKKCPIQDLEENVPQTSTSNQSHCSPIEKSLSSAEKSNSEEPSELESSQNYNNPKTDDHSSSSLSSTVENTDIKEGNSDLAQDDYVDNSLALVPVDLPKASQPTDPLIVSASVKDVLDALRRAREKLQWSLERRQMIKVGSI